MAMEDDRGNGRRPGLQDTSWAFVEGVKGPDDDMGDEVMSGLR